MSKKSANNNGVEFLALIERDEDGMFVGSVPSVQGCHAQARTIPTLFKRLREVLKLCLEAQEESVTPLRFVGVQEISV